MLRKRSKFSWKQSTLTIWTPFLLFKTIPPLHPVHFKSPRRTNPLPWDLRKIPFRAQILQTNALTPRCESLPTFTAADKYLLCTTLLLATHIIILLFPSCHLYANACLTTTTTQPQCGKVRFEKRNIYCLSRNSHTHTNTLFETRWKRGWSHAGIATFSH